MVLIPARTPSIGEVNVKGVELGAQANLVNGFKIIGGLTYLDAEVTKTTSSAAAGTTPIQIPDLTASLWLDYTVESGNLEGLGGGVGVRYVGKGAGDPGNTFFTDDYALVDAAISYDLGATNAAMKGWKVQVNAQNLFDKEYISGCYGTTQCSFGLRRTVLATLSYRW